MGIDKNRAIIGEQKEAAAIEICIRKKTMARCLIHSDIVYDNYGDIEEAYKFANYLYAKKDPLTLYFDSRKDMTDMIKKVIDKHGDACYQCQDND